MESQHIAEPPQAPDADSGAVLQELMLSSALAQFEALLEHPEWFRWGTSLEASPAPMPQLLTVADDLQMLANICRNGALPAVLSIMLAAPRVPLSKGWAVGMGLAPTLQDVLDLMIAELALRNPFLGLRVLQQGGEGRVEVNVRSSVPLAARPLAMLGPMFLIYRHVAPYGFGKSQICHIDTDVEAQPALLTLGPPPDLQVHFDAPRNQLRFPGEWLELPNPDSDPAMWAVFRDRLRSRSHTTSPMLRALNNLISECLRRGERPARLPQVAAILGMSERSLVRRLGELGTSYTGLIASERRALAAELMADPANSLQAISDQLAFPDRQGFGRAFRKWHAESPGQFRRRLFAS